MADFINSVDFLGDDAVIDSIIMGTIAEFKDDTIVKILGQVFCAQKNLTTVDLPNVTYMKYGFQDCTSLKNVNLPALVDVYEDAFLNCTSLEEIDLPSAVNFSGYSNFKNCKKLGSINVPLAVTCPSLASCVVLPRLHLPSVTVFNTNACRGCSALSFVDTGASLTKINSFSFYDCASLKTLIIRATTDVVSLYDTKVFYSTPITAGTGYIYVPSDLLESYKTADNWSTYADQFRALEDYTVDGTTTGEFDETKI